MLAPETNWGYAGKDGVIQIDADDIYEDLSLNFARRKKDWNSDKREYTGWDVIDVYRGDGSLKDTLTVFPSPASFQR